MEEEKREKLHCHEKSEEITDDSIFESWSRFFKICCEVMTEDSIFESWSRVFNMCCFGYRAFSSRKHYVSWLVRDC